MRLKNKILPVFLALSVSAFFFSCERDGSSREKGEIRDITSMELVSEMTLGWNLGDTLDVCAADRDGDGRINEAPAEGEEVDETLWGNPEATPELFKKLKEDGFNAVRIPVTWRDHLGDAPEYKISENWMDRVEEVVNYAFDQDMYVIINVHHDGGGDPDFGAWIRNASTDYDNVIEKYKAVWTQIADRFENYSDKLIFESMNEVGFDDLSESQKYEMLNTINQEFVDLIRSSSGNNPKRHLLIAGYYTDIDMTCNSLFKMPDDPENRCILSVHYYTPWEFCTTNITREWGTIDEQRQMQNLVHRISDAYIDSEIPVIVGEYGTCSGNDTQSRALFCGLMTKICMEKGIPAFLWDNGSELDRNTLEWKTPEIIEAIQQAADGEGYEIP